MSATRRPSAARGTGSAGGDRDTVRRRITLLKRSAVSVALVGFAAIGVAASHRPAGGSGTASAPTRASTREPRPAPRPPLARNGFFTQDDLPDPRVTAPSSPAPTPQPAPPPQAAPQPLPAPSPPPVASSGAS